MPDPFGLTRAEIERLLRYVKRKVGTPQDAEDVLQDVLLALVSRWNLGLPVADLGAWLYGVARNKIVDWYRRKSRYQDADASDLWDMADAHAATPQQEAARRELRKVLIDAIGKLPKEQREVFTLHEIDGLSFKEIQKRTGAPLNTLLSRKRYAVLKLRQQLEGILEEHEEV